jgi:hypothetical protein
VTNHEFYCRPTDDLFVEALGDGLVWGAGVALLVMLVFKLFGADWGTTFLVGLCLFAIVCVIAAAWNFYEYVDTRAYYQRKYHSQPSTSLQATRASAQLATTAQVMSRMMAVQNQNAIESMPVFKAAATQARAYIRTSGDEDLWRRLTEALVREVLGIVDDANHMRSTPQVRAACDRYVARMRSSASQRPQIMLASDWRKRS